MRTVLLIALILLASACGGGGDDTLSGIATGEPISLTTTALLPANVGHVFRQQLLASGGRTPYTWSVSPAGDPLPAGLQLDVTGELSGIPAAPSVGSVILVVRSSDSQVDTGSFLLEVRDLAITPGSPGAVDPGTPIDFQASGGSAAYVFTFVSNMSGGTLTTGGSYVAGLTTGVDVVRATDHDGFLEEVSVTVGNDPFAGFVARWGTTDVWWLDWDVSYDPDPLYATDIDLVLAALGLRQMDSHDADGTEADRIARLLLIRRCLGHLSTYYGNSFDGGMLPGGIAISFVGPAGPEAGSTPPPGDVYSGGTLLYNTICLRHGPTSNVVGTAWLDDGNDSIEHDCGTPSGTPLGVFANRLLPIYLSTFNDGLVDNPVGPADVDGLRWLLEGNDPRNARERDMLELADGFGRVLGAILAHEIGHSLGLRHSDPSTGSGDIMNAALSVGPSVQYAFNPTHWAQLLDNLPGPNRS